MDCSPQGSSVHGIFQARMLEWVAIPFSRGSSWPRKRTWVSHIVARCFTLWATREAHICIKQTANENTLNSTDVWKGCTQYASKFGKLSSGHRTGKDQFKGNAKECSNYRTIASISHASKVMLKILQARCQQNVNRELPDVQVDLEKAEEPEIKLPTSIGSLKKQESSRKTSTSVLLTMSKPLAVWITINWKILKEMGIPDHRTCLLRNLHTGQEAS